MNRDKIEGPLATVAFRTLTEALAFPNREEIPFLPSLPSGFEKGKE